MIKWIKRIFECNHSLEFISYDMAPDTVKKTWNITEVKQCTKCKKKFKQKYNQTFGGSNE